jgi:hypothetical protein
MSMLVSMCVQIKEKFSGTVCTESCDCDALVFEHVEIEIGTWETDSAVEGADG